MNNLNKFYNITLASEILWAKKEQDGSRLPLLTHMSDSAGIARKLWNCWISDGVKSILSENVDNSENVEELFVFLSAVHDIGKATPVFQCKAVSELTSEVDSFIFNNLKLAGLVPFTLNDFNYKIYFPYANKTQHSLASQIILENYGIDETISCIAGSHHGKPVDFAVDSSIYQSYSKNFFINNEYKELWEKTQFYIIEQALELSGFESKEEIPKANMIAQFLLSGLLVMVDWLASNKYNFPYLTIDDDFKFKSDNKRVQNAWNNINLTLPWDSSNQWMYESLYDKRFGFKATLLQKNIEDLAKNITNPGLFVLEAPMGSGKTEAALVVAEVLSSRLGKSGVFFALPTQATSNGIFNRILKWVERLEDDTSHTIKLSHGKAQFNDDYQDLKSLTGSTNVNFDNSDTSVFVNDWFEGSKKSLLADFVVGTIDQVLMAALKHKHMMLRHLGLSNKVVIIDECHAYDAYMSTYLEMSLKWLGAYNVPVILLSATLPNEKKMKLINAYINEFDDKKDISTYKNPLRKNSKITPNSKLEVEELGYPKITYTENNIIKSKSFKSENNLMVNIVSQDANSLSDKLEEMLDKGGCAGIIVNTVKKAQEIYSQLESTFPKENIRLFHSYFTSTERFKRENQLIKELGKPSTNNARPYKLIVIGTQVLEQSLDIDFDVMFTELSPMDLLLQRLGRLHRHNRDRPEKLKKPKFYILDSQDKKYNYGSELVYGKYILMRSKAALPDVVNIPSDIPGLVEKVYNESFELEGLNIGDKEYIKAKTEWDNTKLLKEEKAKTFRLPAPNKSYSHGDNIVGLLDTSISANRSEAAVRDGDDSIEVIIIKKTKSGYIHLMEWNNDKSILEKTEVPDEKTAKKISKERINLPRVLCQKFNIDNTINELEKNNQELLGKWQESVWLKGELFLIVDEDNSALLNGYRLKYDREIGLIYKKEEKNLER